MKQLPQVLFWLGLISIPFAWLVWYVGDGNGKASAGKY